MQRIPVQLDHILELTTGPDEVSLIGEYIPEEPATATEPAVPDRVEGFDVWNRKGKRVTLSGTEYHEVEKLLLAEGRRHVERGRE